MRLAIALDLAKRDLVHGWASTLCMILGAGIALAPVLLLFGLNYGFVTGLIETLREDPRTRELRPIGQYALNADWFTEWAADERVGFVLPRTRYLASSATLRAEGVRGVMEVELIPTAPKDPLLPDGFQLSADNQIAITASVAAKLERETGDRVQIRFSRRNGEKREGARLDATVAVILDRGVYQRDAIFASQALVDAAERWREGGDAPLFGWDGDAGMPDRISYASFRLFARDVRDVIALRDKLVGLNIDARTNAEAIERALLIEASLTWVFLLILALSSIGVLLTLGFQLAAAIAEKARELSILRMLGLNSRELAAIPMIQGALIAGGAAAISGIIILMFQPLLNASLDGVAGIDGPISRLEPSHAAIAAAAMAVAGGVSGIVAGLRAARLEPSEGLRYE